MQATPNFWLLQDCSCSSNYQNPWSLHFVRACTFENQVIKKKRKEKDPKNPDTLTGSHQPPTPKQVWRESGLF
jgi:hypothetical protein